jgi:hypothetical protein
MKEDETPIFVSVNPHIINKNDSKADLSKNWTNCEISLTKLTDVIRQGWAYSAWYKQQRRSNDQFVAINIASIDIDGTRTIDEVVEDPFCQKHLSCLYTTSSHTDQEHRFRLIFILPRVIECQKEYRHVLQALATMLVLCRIHIGTKLVSRSP